MALYKLDDYEANHYDDSDFYDIYFDSEEKKLKTVEIWSTRCGGRKQMPYAPLTEDIKEQARQCLEEYIFKVMRSEEQFRVYAPEKVEKGARIKILEPHRNREKEEIETECPKCEGTGKWINPRNESDIRECFACKGTGKAKKTKAKSDGKMVSYEIGLRGEVLWIGLFGSFYRNGYKQPGREYYQLLVKLDDGRKLNIPLAKCGLDEEMETEANIRNRAKKYSFNYCWMVIANRFR